MNKKDIAKIRRRFAPDKNAISIVRGCYVNEKKEIVSTFSKSLLNLPESEAEHYLTTFKRTLGGAAGRNQFSIGVPDSRLLRRLQTSELKDEASVGEFYRAVIGATELEGSYLILMMHDAWDIPRKKDAPHGERPEFDGEVFNYILVSVCPVKQTKSQLTFFTDDRQFHTAEPDLAVGAPALGFMYPVYEDGGANVSAAQYYTKDAADIHADFINAVFGVEAPRSAADQRQLFYDTLSDTLDDAMSFDVMQTLHENLTAQMADRKKDAEPLEVSRREIASLLSGCNVPESRIAAFEAEYQKKFGAVGLDAGTIVEPRRFEIATETITVNVDPTRSDLVEMKRIDGRRCIILHVEGAATVNGVEVNI